MSDERFGRWLARQLEQRELSAAEFARRIGSSPGVVSHWIRGARVPSPTSLVKIADVLDVDVDRLLVIAGHRPAVAGVKEVDPAGSKLADRVLRLGALTQEEASALSYVVGRMEADRRGKR